MLNETHAPANANSKALKKLIQIIQIILREDINQRARIDEVLRAYLEAH